MLEQREAVIGDMISQETDLKEALQDKARTESQLREDKKLLHSVSASSSYLVAFLSEVTYLLLIGVSRQDCVR